MMNGNNKSVKKNRYLIPNLQNACQILKFLSRHEEGLTISKISADLNIPYTSCLRILSTLKEEGLLKVENSKYLLGGAVIPIGLSALNRIDLRKAAIPVLKDLSKETGETSHLAIPSNDKSLLIEVCQSPQPIRVGAPSGTVVDLYNSSTGKVFLAYLIDDLEAYCNRTEMIKKTENTITNFTDMQREVKIIRRQGYSVDDVEYAEGVRCLAAPVFGANKKVVAAIGITGTSQRFTKQKIKTFSKAVLEASRSISSQIGS